MSWLVPALIATLCGTFFLLLLYLYFYFQDRNKYILIWATSWFSYFIRILFMLLSVVIRTSAFFSIMTHVAGVLTGFILLWGSLVFLEKKIPLVVTVATVVVLSWAAVGALLKVQFFYYTLPVSMYFAAANIVTGMILLHARSDVRFERCLAGVAFIVWGVHIADYPWLRQVEPFAPWGFLIATLLEFAVAVGIILLYAQKTRIDLRNKTAQVRTIIETIPDIVWVKDTEGRYLFCNRRFEQYFGATEGELIGKTDHDIVSREEADKFSKHDEITLKALEPVTTTEDFTFAEDGHIESTETTKTVMLDEDGDIVGVLGIARDVTDRRRLEVIRRETNKLESIGRFAGGIAHDINNILSPIVGLSDLLLQDVSENSECYSSLKDINKAGIRGSDLAKQILDLSRKTDEQLVPVSLQSVIRDVISLSKSVIPSRVQVDVSIDENCCLVYANPSKMHQIVMNIFTNALHAIDLHGGRIDLALSEKIINDKISRFGARFSGEYAVLSISDNGHGIGSEVVNKIFDPYFTTKEHGKGTGLGLSIVLGIVEENSGDIEISSLVGNGTTVKVYLPKYKMDNELSDKESVEHAG